MPAIFPRVYDRLMQPLEQSTFAAMRKDLLSQVQGRVLDLGAGTGANFPYYLPGTEVVALDPEPLMLRQAVAKNATAGVRIHPLIASGEAIPLAAASVDVVVTTLVLCTVPDPARTLLELMRVLKPGGHLVGLEHVRLQHWSASLQDLLTPVWRRICGGCHLNRDTLGSIRAAGFQEMHNVPHHRGLFVQFAYQRP